MGEVVIFTPLSGCTGYKNESDVEDVAQEAFLKAFRKLSAFRGQSKLSAWLISITRNEARRRFWRHRTLGFESLEKGGHVSPAVLRDWIKIPSGVLERSEVWELLQTAVNHLSPIYLQVLLVRDLEELSIEETATGSGDQPLPCQGQAASGAYDAAEGTRTEVEESES